MTEKTFYANCGSGIMVPLFATEYPGRVVIVAEGLTLRAFERAVRAEYPKVAMITIGRQFRAEVVG